MKKVLFALSGILVVVVIAVVVVFAWPTNATGPVGDVTQQAKSAATNAVIDASGIKDTVKSAIDNSRGAIIEATGLSADQVDAAISKLDIDNWKAVALPADAQETATIEGSSLGIPGNITTYSNPGYLSVSAYGQTVTLEVPAGVQELLPYLNQTN